MISVMPSSAHRFRSAGTPSFVSIVITINCGSSIPIPLSLADAPARRRSTALVPSVYASARSLYTEPVYSHFKSVTRQAADIATHCRVRHLPQTVCLLDSRTCVRIRQWEDGADRVSSCRAEESSQ